jgi:Undecaprenyl-phosphate galactose phosphotransferase WbaP
MDDNGMSGILVESRSKIPLQRLHSSGFTRPIDDAHNKLRLIHLKRLVDIFVSLNAMIIFFPLCLAICVLVACDGGPVFFGHERIGRSGRRFRCLKFRTMVVDADQVLRALLERDSAAHAEWNRDFKLRQDPRITRIGSFLRRTSLDELPQIINVLRGEMSLVGPRPIVEAEIERYGDDIASYYACLPGITGLWQISGRNDTTYACRVRLDVQYVNTQSLWNDFVILVKTVGMVVRGSGAY